MQKINSGVTAPKGFLAGGVHCGVKTNNTAKKDIAIIYSEKPCTAAAVYTQNKVFGAPITVTRRNIADGMAQAVVCNSGNANTCNADGVIEFANNLAFNNVPAREMLRERLGVDNVFVENDANCAALGEAFAGCGNGSKNFVAVTLGTGVGSGIILDGKIVNGVNCAGGECGHMVIMVDGEQCSCGRKGCWEAYASATALIRQTKRAMDDYPDSIMHRLAEEEGGVNGKTAFDAMRLGDIAGIEVVNNYIKYVSCGLINLVNALQPEIICIGGGICNEGDTLMEPLRRYVQAERYSIHSKIQTQIVKAQLGNNAGIIGAALLYQVK